MGGFYFLVSTERVLTYVWFLSVAGLAQGAFVVSSCFEMRNGYIKGVNPEYKASDM